MRKLYSVSLMVLCLAALGKNTLGQELDPKVEILKNENTDGGASGIEYYNENQLRFFELENELKALKEEKAKKELKLTGFIGTKVEVEELSKDINEGKVKFVFAEGILKHEDYDSWSLFYHVAKEQYFKSKMWDRSGSPQNTIVEIAPRYQYNFKNEKGLTAFELIYTSESIDNRDAVKPKASIFYMINDKLATNFYTLVGREFKGGYDDYEFVEIEPGFSYRFTDNLGMGVNYFLKWGQTSNEKFTERERFFKPYIWRNFQSLDLGLSLWGEIGPYSNNVGDRNSNTKFGISGNKKLTESLTMVGEVSYKREDKKKSNEKVDITLVMLGLQYSF